MWNNRWPAGYRVAHHFAMSYATLRIVFVCWSFVGWCHGWDLRLIGIDQFRLRQVSLYHSRAFLTIESDNASLVEASWPENAVNHRPRILSDDCEVSCNGLRQVLWTDVDRLARLWILDGGGRAGRCRTKLIIRSLLSPSNVEIRHQFSDSSDMARSFHMLVVDPVPASDGDTRAFITLHDRDYLLLYSLFKRSVGKLKFEKKDLTPLLPISLAEITINHYHLYVADSLSGRMFSLPIKNLRQLSFPEDGVGKIIMKTNVTYLGRLLGPPTGLKLDFRDNLFYILPRDGAVMKWTPSRSLKAENHRVVFQQGFSVSQIVLGIAGKAWIVASDYISRESRRHCVRIVV